MHELVDQLEQSLASGHYFLSLFTALAFPDIAAALDAPDGQASSARYATWYEKWVRPQFKAMVLGSLPPEVREHVNGIENPLDGDACYRFRCSLLHQGSTQHPKSPFSRIIFVEPHATLATIHYCTMKGALCIDLQEFCREVIAGVRLWLRDVEETELYKANYERFARRHPDGLEPYIVGVPVVG